MLCLHRLLPLFQVYEKVAYLLTDLGTWVSAMVLASCCIYLCISIKQGVESSIYAYTILAFPEASKKYQVKRLYDYFAKEINKRKKFILTHLLFLCFIV